MFSVLGLRPTATSSFSASSCSCLPSLVVSVQPDAFAGLLNVLGARAGFHANLLLAEGALQLLGDVFVLHRDDARQHLDHGTSVPKRRKMEANSTPTAPAPMMIRLFGTAVRLRISMLVRMVSGSGFEAGQHARFRAGGDDDVLRLQRLRRRIRPSLRSCRRP